MSLKVDFFLILLLIFLIPLTGEFFEKRISFFCFDKNNWTFIYLHLASPVYSESRLNLHNWGVEKVDVH